MTDRMTHADHPPVAFGERPKPYRDASGQRWQWWGGQWRKVKTQSQRRAEKRYRAAVAPQRQESPNHGR